ncbi:hypothetical protein Taro_000297 [Colocasia esculenta]|uniref:Uncharacterized protein n=1 Tax=Colocasia esculenta TaxID=4460 RepID=A0A843T7G8_COLES|nr:hypothetical protein [Colocasia esculenta]
MTPAAKNPTRTQVFHLFSLFDLWFCRDASGGRDLIAVEEDDTIIVAVVLGGIGVDANLIMMQVIGSPKGRFPTLFSIPLAPACCPSGFKASNSSVYVASSTTPTVVTSPVGCPRFFVSQAVSSGLCPGTCVVPSRSVSSDLDTLTLVFELHVRLRERRQWDSDNCVSLYLWFLVCSILGEFPTEPVTTEAHPYPHRLRPVRGRRTRIKYVIGLTGLAEAFRHSWYQNKKSLKWLIEEIGVVEEMIRRKAPSV